MSNNLIGGEAMKPEELMLGDIVLASGKPIHVTLATLSCKVDVKPMPLTEEILKKSGFKYSEWYGWQIKEPDFTLCFVGDTPHFLLDDIFVCDCPYVHTLQHALKLCGIEKEVVV